MAQTTAAGAELPGNVTFFLSNLNAFAPLKLDQNNYMVWESHMKNALDANDLLGYVDGITKAPAEFLPADGEGGDPTPNPLYRTWCKVDKQLKIGLTTRISDVVLPQVSNLVHVAEIWDYLKKRYQTTSKSHILEMKLKLLNSVKDCTMELYLDRIGENGNRLTAAGQPVSDEDLVLYTVNGLGHEYAALKMTVRAGLQTISFNDLCSLLRSEEIHITREQKLLQSADAHSAFAAQVTYQQGYNQVSNTGGNSSTTSGLITEGGSRPEGNVHFDNYGGSGRGSNRNYRGGRNGGRCQRSSSTRAPLCTGAPGDAAVTASFSPAGTQLDASAGLFSSELESPKDANGLKLILTFDKGPAAQPSQISMSPTVSKVLTTSAVLGKECDDSSSRVKKENEE